MTIIDTLTKRRNESAVEIRSLTESLTHLDATIKLFAPEHQVPRSSGITRAILNALRESGKSMTIEELSTATGYGAKKIVLFMCKKRGLFAGLHASAVLQAQPGRFQKDYGETRFFMSCPIPFFRRLSCWRTINKETVCKTGLISQKTIAGHFSFKTRE